MWLTARSRSAGVTVLRALPDCAANRSVWRQRSSFCVCLPFKVTCDMALETSSRRCRTAWRRLWATRGKEKRRTAAANAIGRANRIRCSKVCCGTILRTRAVAMRLSMLASEHTMAMSEHLVRLRLLVRSQHGIDFRESLGTNGSYLSGQGTHFSRNPVDLLGVTGLHSFPQGHTILAEFLSHRLGGFTG